MGIEHIEDAGDERLAIYRNVRDPQLLRQHGVFMAESREVVRRLLLSSRFVPQSILVNRASYDGLREVFEATRAAAPVYVATQPVLEAVTGYHIHRGCLAAGEQSFECL